MVDKAQQYRSPPVIVPVILGHNEEPQKVSRGIGNGEEVVHNWQLRLPHPEVVRARVIELYDETEGYGERFGGTPREE